VLSIIRNIMPKAAVYHWKNGRKYCKKWRQGKNKYGPWRKCKQWTKYTKGRKGKKGGGTRTVYVSAKTGKIVKKPKALGGKGRTGRKLRPIQGPKAPKVPYSGIDYSVRPLPALTAPNVLSAIQGANPYVGAESGSYKGGTSANPYLMIAYNKSQPGMN
jgi:hypothetical protein